MDVDVAITSESVELLRAGQKQSYMLRATLPSENPNGPVIGVGAYLVRSLKGAQKNIQYEVEVVIFSRLEDSAALTGACAQAGLVLSNEEEKKYTKTPDGANMAHDRHGQILIEAGLPVATRGRVLTHAPGSEENNLTPPSRAVSALTKLSQLSLPGQKMPILPLPTSYSVAVGIASALTPDFLTQSDADQRKGLQKLFAFLDEDISSELPPLDQDGPPRGDPTMRSERGGPRTVL